MFSSDKSLDLLSKRRTTTNGNFSVGRTFAVSLIRIHFGMTSNVVILETAKDERKKLIILVGLIINRV